MHDAIICRLHLKCDHTFAMRYPRNMHHTANTCLIFFTFLKLSFSLLRIIFLEFIWIWFDLQIFFKNWIFDLKKKTKKKFTKSRKVIFGKKKFKNAKKFLHKKIQKVNFKKIPKMKKKSSNKFQKKFSKFHVVCKKKKITS